MNIAQPRIPSSTYRLQFNQQFTFAQAQAIVPYLDALGISDCYASPYFQARAGSLHGYDITDHNKLNAAIGSRADYDAWVAQLHARGMGQILDFVPNHMGVGESLNHWWFDVLENGASSIYAPYFDIDWRPLKTDLQDKVLLPILGDQYGRVLERGELKVGFESGAFHLDYYAHRFPIAPGTYRHILQISLENLAQWKDETFYGEFQSILTALEYLPRRTETDPERIAERVREKEIVKRRLERRGAEAPPVQRAIEDALTTINGTPGDARSFDRLDELLNAQSYRLAFWRVAAEEINYRRFFDVNDLAAIRMELPEVFDATHALLLELVQQGAVTGLRIDHPDGLSLPREYFEKLQARCAEALGASLPADQRAVYLVVEKILSGSEQLRRDWPVHGTTGYDFTNQVIGVLVDGAAERAITATFQKFIGHSMHFGHLVYAKKRLVTRLSLANDVNVLGSMLDRVSERNRWFRDFTLEALSRAVRETIACFPVYRTYLAPGHPVDENDRNVIERAVAAAKRRNPAMEGTVFDFLRDVLLFQFPKNLTGEERAEHENFVLKFQQSTGPIMAKGLEDTAFYIFNRLAALSEVGGEPQRFGLSVAAFHECNLERLKNWPSSLLTTSTHDTKRSEDVRARMAAISEIPDVWRRALVRWRSANRRWKRKIDDEESPDANEEYLLYQILLGTWPLPGADRTEYVARIQQYMAKALKEAKVNTSWIRPNENWDDAMSQFIADILDPARGRRFLESFVPLAEEVARLGAVNSLSQLLLKCTVPGVPDFYQGTDIWDDSLVDPDNRRPVDYERRAALLAALPAATPEDLLEHWPDGRIKLFLTQRLLLARRANRALFDRGSYLPISLSGTFADCCIAFARVHEGRFVLIFAPRLSSRIGFPPLGERWRDTFAQWPAELPRELVRDVFTEAEFRPEHSEIRLADVFARLPVAVWTNAAR